MTPKQRVKREQAIKIMLVASGYIEKGQLFYTSDKTIRYKFQKNVVRKERKNVDRWQLMKSYLISVLEIEDINNPDTRKFMTSMFAWKRENEIMEPCGIKH